MTAVLAIFLILFMISMLVFFGATLYYRYKNQTWLNSFDGWGPPTEDEAAIGDEWIQPDVAPEHANPPPGFAPCTREAPHDGPCAHPAIQEAELVSEEALEELLTEVSPEPMADLSAHRIAMPKAKDMVGIMYQKSVEHEQAFGANGILGVDDSEPCLMCAERSDHFHTGADVKVYIEREARASFDKHVADMDLTQLGVEATEKLLMRVKARLEWMASLDAMKRFDKLYDAANRALREEAEDEAFYQQTIAEEKARLESEKSTKDAIIDEMKEDMVKKYGHNLKDYVVVTPSQGDLSRLAFDTVPSKKRSKKPVKKAKSRRKR